MEIEIIQKRGDRRDRCASSCTRRFVSVLLFLSFPAFHTTGMGADKSRPSGPGSTNSASAESTSEKAARFSVVLEKSAKPPESIWARRGDLPPVFLKPVPTSIEDLKSFEAHTENLVKRVSACVVAVEVRGGTGSGVIISKDGLVLTAAHVCGEPFLDVIVRFADGTSVKGKTLGTDHDTDSGLVRITEKGSWPQAALGELLYARPGDWVLALGHPGRILQVGDGMIRTDSTLIGGDSGGALFDMHGRVVGIHSRISTATTENYHVAIGNFQRAWPRLVSGECWGEEEQPTFSWVGARCADRPEGCRIERVEESSPAERAKIRVGDIVQSVNDHEVADYMSFLRRVAESDFGEDVILKIKSDGAERNVTVKFPGDRRRRLSR
jgi:serine protease Do